MGNDEKKQKGLETEEKSKKIVRKWSKKKQIMVSKEKENGPEGKNEQKGVKGEKVA